MKITAHGYAKLTEKLRPDLAVLEGGYAIETALPYVNMAIILSLAGLDYTGVREPDFWPGRFKESPEKVALVHRLVEELLGHWEKRDKAVPEPKYVEGNYYQREKHIFYDTDYIDENQVERLRLCDHCPGYLSIESSANHGYGNAGNVLCLSIPYRACSKCRNEALDLYTESKNKSKYQYIYLQDKISDTFMGYDTGKRSEWRTEG